MANIVNERDLLLQNAATRVVDVTLPDNVVPPALKAVTLSAPSTTFRVATDNSSSPSAITLNANLRAISGTPTMTWSVTPTGAATLTGTDYGVRTLTYVNMAQDYCTVRVEVNDGGMIYFDEMSFAKVRDGSKGVDGRRGSISTAKAVTGSTWSDAQALQALSDLGATTPLATDTVTLYNASANYAEMRRYDGTGWVAVASSMPGSVLMNGSIVTEKLLVTGLGIALNPDPNTQDISAWTGTGLSIVTDTTSPSGSTALECTGLAATVLSKKFPIDPTKNYKARFWTKRQSGTSTTYGTVAFYDASGNVITGTSNGIGWPGKGTFHYFGLVNGALPAAWTEYSISFGPGESAVLPSNARFMAIGVLSNYTGTGVQRVAAPLVHLKTTGDMVVDGTLTASKIDTRGLSIKDDAGNVILAAGNALDWGMIGGTGKPADSATVGATFGINISGKILRANATAFIENAAISTALIDQLAVTDAKISDLNAEKILAGTISAGRIDLTKLSGESHSCTSPGTYSFTVPADKLTVRLTLVGGGGGGGGGSWRSAYGPWVTSGGGSGGVNTLVFTANAGDVITVTVGNGGAGGQGHDGPYDYWDPNNTLYWQLCSGKSGTGTVAYKNGVVVGSASGGGGGSPGSRSDAWAQWVGSAGSPNGSTGLQGSSDGAVQGAGGSCKYGAGGAGGVSGVDWNAVPGRNGAGYGSGGGGGVQNSAWGWGAGGTGWNYLFQGGKGADGWANVEFYNPQGVVTRQELVDKGIL